MRTVLIALAVLLAGAAAPEEVPEIDDGIHLYEDILAEENIRDLLRRARAEQGKDWDKALGLLDQLLDKYGSALCPSASPRLYRRVDDRIREEILAMPAEVLERHRLKADADARRLLALASERLDPAPARQALERHGVSRLGRKAADLLGDLCMEAGDTLSAASAWEASAEDPSLGGEKDPVVLAKLALARSRQGRLADAKALAARIPRGMVLNLGGREVGGPDLAAWLEQAVPVGPPASVGSVWASVGGSSSRNALSDRISAIEPQRAWEIDSQPAVVMQAFYDPSGAMRLLPFCHGAMSGGVFAVTDGAALHLVDASSGKRLGKGNWGGGTALPQGQAQVHARHFAVTLAGNLAFANLRRTDDAAEPAFRGGRGWGAMGPAGPRSGLLAVEIDKGGKRKWKFPEGQDPEVSSLDVRTSPVVCGEVLVAACTRMSTSSEVWLVGLGLEDGRLRWKRFLCASPSDEMGAPSGEPALAAEGGTVFCATQRGALIAVEASTGRPCWAYRYAEDRKADARPVAGRMRVRRPEALTASLKPFSPPVVSGGVVYALPADGRDLLALEASTGRPLWQRAVEADQLLGVVGGRLVLTGGSKCSVLDAAPGGRLATIPVPDGGAAGRGLLTPDAVFLPTAKGIQKVDLGTLKLAGQVLAWPEGFSSAPAPPQPQGRGRRLAPTSGVGANLTVSGGWLFAVGTQRVLAFPAPSSREPELLGAVEASPLDPAPRLDLARLYRSENRIPQALEALRGAWPLCGEGSPCRKAVAEALVTALLDASAAARRSGDPRAAAGFLKEAAALPAAPSEEAGVRLDLGRALAEAGDPQGALAEFQTVLDRLGDAVVDRQASSRASTAALKGIEALSAADPRIRCEREEEAAKALRSALQDPARLAALQARFPETVAAAEALLTQAKLMLGADPDRGVRMLTACAARSPGSPVSIEALEALLDQARSRKDPAWETGIVREIRRQLALSASPPERIARRLRAFPEPADPWASEPFPLEESWILVMNERMGLLAAPEGDAWAWSNALLLSSGQMVDATGGKVVWQPEDLRSPRPWMGVSQDPDGTILHVRPGSQAERAGIRVGDRLLSLDGIPIGGNLPEVVRKLKPGQVVKAQVQRGARTLDLGLQLARRPGDGDLRFLWSATQGPFVLLGSPTEVCAYDAATRAMAWRLDLGSSAPHPGLEEDVPDEDASVRSEILWSQVDGREAAAAGEGVCVALDGDGGLSGVDLVRGERLWERHGEGFSAPLVPAGPGEVVSLRARGPALHFVERATGRSRAVVCLPSAPCAAPLWAPDRLLVACGRSLLAVDPASAKTLWTAEGLPANPSALVREGAAAVVLAGGQVQAFDAASGKPLWKLGLEGLSASGASVADGVLYLMLKGAGEKAPGALLAAETATGRVLWRQPLGHEAACPGPAILGRWVVADAGRDPEDPGGGDNLVVFVDRATGKRAWTLRMPWSRGRLRSIRRSGPGILLETSSGIYCYTPLGNEKEG